MVAPCTSRASFSITNVGPGTERRVKHRRETSCLPLEIHFEILVECRRVGDISTLLCSNVSGKRSYRRFLPCVLVKGSILVRGVQRPFCALLQPAVMTEPPGPPSGYQLNWDPGSPEITLGNAQLPASTSYESPRQSATELHGRQFSRKILPSRSRPRLHAYTKKSPTGQDYRAERKLREAANQSDIDTLLTLVMQGVNPCSADSKSRTALHFAATQGNEHIIKVLLDRGANPNAKDLNGNTPLHLAACTNQIKIVTLLLQAGTDINAVDATGRTPLDVAYSRLKMLQGNVSVRSTPSKYRGEVTLIIDMLNEYLSRAGRSKEQEQLSEISSKFNSVTTVEQVDEVHELLSRFTSMSVTKQGTRDLQ